MRFRGRRMGDGLTDGLTDWGGGGPEKGDWGEEGRHTYFSGDNCAEGTSGSDIKAQCSAVAVHGRVLPS